MKTSLGSKIFDVCNYAFLAVLAFITLFPFWILIMSSFVGTAEYYSKLFVLWPTNWNITAYRFLFGTDWIFTGYKISIYMTVLGSLYSMLLVCLASYAMTFETLPGKTAINWYFIFTMYFGGGLIPYYIMITNYLKLSDNLLVLWLPGGLAVWSFLVLRNFFRGIPSDLRDSATIDGANEFTILWRIILPLSLPSIATLTLFAAVGRWNDWQSAFYYINDTKKLPLANILRKMVIFDTNADPRQNPAYMEMEMVYRRLVGGDRRDIDIFDVAVKNATIAVAALPIMCLYPFFQKYFVKGVLVGSIKG